MFILFIKLRKWTCEYNNFSMTFGNYIFFRRTFSGLEFFLFLFNDFQFFHDRMNPAIYWERSPAVWWRSSPSLQKKTPAMAAHSHKVSLKTWTAGLRDGQDSTTITPQRLVWNGGFWCSGAARWRCAARGDPRHNLSLSGREQILHTGPGVFLHFFFPHAKRRISVRQTPWQSLDSITREQLFPLSLQKGHTKSTLWY